MTLAKFIEEAAGRYRRYGPRGLFYSVQDFRRGVDSRLGMLHPPAMDDVLERDFDLLVVLDACRHDLMESVAGEYPWIDDVGWARAASSSQEWLARTFMERDSRLPAALLDIWTGQSEPDSYARHFSTLPLGDVSYITWNPFSPMLDGGRFRHFEEVWRYKAADEIVEPRDVTGRVIEHMRGTDASRVIAHYQQPHLPFRRGTGVDVDGSAWELYQCGELGHDDMWSRYEDNLRWVLDDVGLLLDNVDADRVVITADHGNALGENGYYGHFPYVRSDGMRSVPWVEVGPAEDSGRHEPGGRPDANPDAERRLEQLGYR